MTRCLSRTYRLKYLVRLIIMPSWQVDVFYHVIRRHEILRTLRLAGCYFVNISNHRKNDFEKNGKTI